MRGRLRCTITTKHDMIWSIILGSGNSLCFIIMCTDIQHYPLPINSFITIGNRVKSHPVLFHCNRVYRRLTNCTNHCVYIINYYVLLFHVQLILYMRRYCWWIYLKKRHLKYIVKNILQQIKLCSSDDGVLLSSLNLLVCILQSSIVC